MSRKVNEAWVAKVLGMRVNTSPGIDVIDDTKGIEVKFTLVGNQCRAGKYPRAWTVLEHEMDFKNNGYLCFWGLGTYELSKPVKEIKVRMPEKLEGLVLRREFWIVPWDWMKDYLPSHTGGETKVSKWENTFRYPKLKDIPKVIQSYEVEKGLLHLTEGVDKSFFDYLVPF